MAKTVLERCDKIVGVKEGSDYFASIGSYKTGEGEAQETRYTLGAYMTVPEKFRDADADKAKAMLLWCKRMTSADNAGIPAKIKAGEITVDEAAAVILSYNGEDFLVRLNETKVREGGVAKVDSIESLAVKKLAVVLKAKVDGGKDLDDYPNAASPPLTEKGKVNFIAWAKQGKEAGHKWYAVAYKLVTNDKGFE